MCISDIYDDMINTKISAKAFFSYESKNRFSFLALAIFMPIILPQGTIKEVHKAAGYEENGL